MELHQLAYFVEVAATGNFTRAAERRHVTQPTLSHQLRKLEDELGEPLFQRTRAGAVLTPLGSALLPRARLILGEIRAVREEALAYAGAYAGVLNVGVIPTMAPYLLPELVRESSRRYPQLRINVREETTDELVRLAHEGDLHMVLLSFDPEEAERAGMLYEEIMRDELLLAVPENHPLAKRRELSLAQVMDCPLILMKEAHCLGAQTLSVCRRAGFSPEVAIRSSQLDTVVALVESGLGLSLVPAMAVPGFRGRSLLFLPLRPMAVSRSVGLSWPRGQIPTRAHEVFRQICREVLPGIGG